jgi:hypothetical protein
MEMVLASMDLWEIVDGSEEAPPSNADPKIIKEYQRRVKKAMSIISINLVDSQLHHIKRCKGPAEAWKTLCNIHETRSLSNILFIHRKFFTCKMQEGEDLLDHINKVKALADQLACLEVLVRDEDNDDLASELATLLRVPNHCLGDPAHARPHHGVCDRTIDA